MWFENRRVTAILGSIESRALRLRESGAIGVGMQIEAAGPQIRLPTERPLYAPVRKSRLDSTGMRPPSDDQQTDPGALFEQVHVDPGPLRGEVRRALRHVPQVGLAELIAHAPLRQGLAELVTYLSLKDDSFAIVYDQARTDQVSWHDADDRVRTATLPRVTFTRTGAALGAGQEKR